MTLQAQIQFDPRSGIPDVDSSAAARARGRLEELNGEKCRVRLSGGLRVQARCGRGAERAKTRSGWSISERRREVEDTDALSGKMPCAVSNIQE